MKRLITEKQEEVYRCRHHDFEGLTEKETALKLKIAVQTVREHLTNLKKNTPQLFPILSKENAEAWGRWYVGGQTCAEIAEIMGTTEDVILKRLQRVKEKMGYTEIITANPNRALSWDSLAVEYRMVSGISQNRETHSRVNDGLSPMIKRWWASGADEYFFRKIE